MVQLAKDNNVTQIRNLDNGWINLLYIDGYEVCLKTFNEDGNIFTVYMDNWSIDPFSIHSYHSDKLVIDKEWLNLQKEKIYSSKNEENPYDINVLKDHLSEDVFYDVKTNYEKVLCK